MMAAKPIQCENALPEAPEIIKAPISVIPEIAFAPDMRGVCSVGGTFEISSKPTKEARTKINRLKIRSSMLKVLSHEY